MSDVGLTGWDRLRHGGLLLDAQRLSEVAAHKPEPLPSFYESRLRRYLSTLLDNQGDIADFSSFLLQKVCGFTESTGDWKRGNQIPAEWGRVTITGETMKPRQIWEGQTGGVLPVFIDREKRVGIGRGRKAASQVLHWLRAGNEQLALLTNGRQWRLLFAGLDFDAWCEWDVDLWLEEGEFSPQVEALRTLLQPALWESTADEPPLLLQAILDSRKGQAELSQILGERVREAVEILVQGHGEVLKERCTDVEPADIYRAAVRAVMRMVVVLFAESRDLLPRDNALYHGSYGLTGLLEELEKIEARGKARLTRSWNAWPRILALFRLVYEGSHHPELPIPSYGGELFTPGGMESSDGLTRTLAVFEQACFEQEALSDHDVYRILQRITRTRVRVRRGRSSTWMPAPVDFSDLSSEYIGILYEGLLDFELRTASAGEPVIFLAVGNHPALPLSRLEAMDDKALRNLLEKMKDTSTGDEEEEKEEEEEEQEEETEFDEKDTESYDDGESDEESDAEDTFEDTDDQRHTTRTRAETWARKAVVVGKLVRKPRGELTPEKKLRYEEKIAKKARQIVTRVVLPGEWYLVRWGGTRKGAGTFYTRPGLAVPTVHRTLRPLAWDPPTGTDGSPDTDAPPTKWTPRKPEEILNLKVADPACGSGTFPVAALRYLTDALFASILHHDRITGELGQALEEILGFHTSTSDVTSLQATQLPCPPGDDAFEDRLRAVLKRYVVERCIYGVDIDPLAVELCRLSLWIETMDRSLPFSFLDHKIKYGNSLIGAWFDQFQHYPVMAWKNREAGDQNHNNGVHFEKGAQTKAIKAFVKDTLTPDIRHFLEGRTIFDTEDPQETARSVHDETLTMLHRLHEMPVQDAAERSRVYREKLVGSKEYREIKDAMDLWCSCWFWPVDDIDLAPLPSTFLGPADQTRAVSSVLTQEKRFFHWELEFPDVFRTQDSGFDAVLGNPPWDIAKSNSKEFFSNIDPLYRSYGKQEALNYQTDYFSDKSVEKRWLEYNAGFKAQSNYLKYSAYAFGDPEDTDTSKDRFSIKRGKANAEFHTRWRRFRSPSRGYTDRNHPFRYQGSADINLYKLFLEQAHALLHGSGRLGLIVPSGLYSDDGTGPLRELFIEHCCWEWLFGFENREKIFDIDSRSKFNPVIIEKGGTTNEIQTAFMRRKLEDWEHGERYTAPYTRDQILRFSPHSKAILEIQSGRDLEILEKIYSNSVLLGDESPNGWGVTYSREFDMTNDSKLFPPRPKWEEQGYQPDEYSRWIKGKWQPIEELWADLGVKPLPEGERRCAQPPYDRLPVPRADIPEAYILSRNVAQYIKEQEIEDIALPLYEGRMIGLHDFCEKGWVRGKGRSAVWRDISWGQKQIEPQYLISAEDIYSSTKVELGPKTAYMRISSSTNTRTTISSYLCRYPAGDSVFFFIPNSSNYARALVLSGIFASFAFDFVLRRRLAGLNMSEFILVEAPLIKSTDTNIIQLLQLTLQLNIGSIIYAPEWIALKELVDTNISWKKHWALSKARRAELIAILNALILYGYGLDMDDASFVFSGCDNSSNDADNHNNPKGFWRVDDDIGVELRQTVITNVAFRDLMKRIENNHHDHVDITLRSFCDETSTTRWKLPDTLRLSYHDQDHGEPEKGHATTESLVENQWYRWQIDQEPEESWRECHLHARNILGESGYQQLIEYVAADKTEKRDISSNQHPEESSVNSPQEELFD